MECLKASPTNAPPAATPSACTGVIGVAKQGIPNYIMAYGGSSSVVASANSRKPNERWRHEKRRPVVEAPYPVCRSESSPSLER
jgi:hypothetical protein